MGFSIPSGLETRPYLAVVLSEEEYKEKRLREVRAFLSLFHPGSIQELHAELVESGCTSSEARATIRAIHDRGAHHIQEELDTCRVLQFWGLLTGIPIFITGIVDEDHRLGWFGLSLFALLAGLLSFLRAQGRTRQMNEIREQLEFSLKELDPNTSSSKT